mmetsp:Transcript_41881/g.135524  ORF Transcript_41881/g.135524 Transcript_41881/m.135524 type:complete len:241 (+) Transcript_41881:324-1046(+)
MSAIFALAPSTVNMRLSKVSNFARYCCSSSLASCLSWADNLVIWNAACKRHSSTDASSLRISSRLPACSSNRGHWPPSNAAALSSRRLPTPSDVAARSSNVFNCPTNVFNSSLTYPRNSVTIPPTWSSLVRMTVPIRLSKVSNFIWHCCSSSIALCPAWADNLVIWSTVCKRHSSADASSLRISSRLPACSSNRGHWPPSNAAALSSRRLPTPSDVAARSSIVFNCATNVFNSSLTCLDV